MTTQEYLAAQESDYNGNKNEHRFVGKTQKVEKHLNQNLKKDGTRKKYIICGENNPYSRAT
jgi:hypothetical protein